MKLAPALLAVVLAADPLRAAVTDAPPLPSPLLADQIAKGDAIVAKGTGCTVKQGELDQAYQALRASYAARGQQLPETQRQTIEYQLLDRIIGSKLLSSTATDADKAEARSRLDKVIEEALAKFGGSEPFEKQLKATGTTLDGFKSKTLEQLVWQTVLDRNLRPKISVTEDDIAKFYKDNPSKFEKPEMVRASHILVSTLDTSKTPPAPFPDEVKAEKLARAKSIKSKADKGEDFAALAKEFSEDPGSKDKGGEYTFPRGKMVKPFEDAAFSLEPGKISDIVETPFGYHIIKVDEKIPAEMVPLDKVHDDLKKGLESQAIQKLIPDFVQQLKKDNGVEITLPMPDALKNQPKA